MMDKKYYSISLRISFISVLANILLTAVKFFIALATNSISVMADALHSFSDLVTTLVVIFSLRLSKKPADEKHPFGYGRIEDVGSLFVCFALALVGVHFFTESVVRLINPSEVAVTTGFIFLIWATVLVKLILAVFTHFFAKKINSSILSTDAAHHYSDALTSMIVAIGLIFIKKGYDNVDAYLGILVSLVIIVWAVLSAKEFVSNLIGKKISKEEHKVIKKIALSFPNVDNVHDIEAHYYGHNKIISLHVVVHYDLSLEAAHSISDSIEKKILKDGLGKSVVHIDLNRQSSKKRRTEVEKFITELIKTKPCVKDFHAFEIIYTENLGIVSFHIIFDKKTSLDDSHSIAHEFSRRLKDKFNFSKVNIHVEPNSEE